MTTILLIAIVSFSIFFATSAKPQEYCFPNSFNQSCTHNQVILLTSARYGRMEKGKCVTSDYHVGCWAEVLKRVDRRCSGRPSCFLSIPDPSMHAMQPCPKDLLAYLEADYSCVEVEVQTHANVCHPPRHAPIKVSKPLIGWLSSHMTLSTGQGSERCPWEVTMQQGQTMKLTLYDFGVDKIHSTNTRNLFHIHSVNQLNKNISNNDNTCIAYAKVVDPLSENIICGGQTRESVVHQSNALKTQLTLYNVIVATERIFFLIKYQVTGCSDPVVKDKMLVAKRDGQRVRLACNTTRKAWNLVCQGSRWVGSLGNCSDGSMDGSGQPNFLHADNSIDYLKNGLLMAVLIGLFLGLLIGFLMLAIIVAFNKSNRSSRLKNHAENVSHNKDNKSFCQTGSVIKNHVLGSLANDVMNEGDDMGHNCSEGSCYCSCGGNEKIILKETVDTSRQMQQLQQYYSQQISSQMPQSCLPPSYFAYDSPHYKQQHFFSKNTPHYHHNNNNVENKQQNSEMVNKSVEHIDVISNVSQHLQALQIPQTFGIYQQNN